MKKLMITLALAALFVFGISTSALAASTTQDTSCTGYTIINSGDTALLDSSGNAACTDVNALFDSLKSYGFANGWTGNVQDCSGNSDAQDSNTVSNGQDCYTVADIQDNTAVSDVQDSNAVSGGQDNTTASDVQDSDMVSNGQDCYTVTNTQDWMNSATVQAACASLKDLLESYGCYIPDASTGNYKTQSDVQNDAAVPTNSSDSQTTATPNDSDVTASPSDNTDNLSYAQQVTDLVNEQRAAYGLEPLTLNEELTNVAQLKSQDMHDNNYFSHTSPTYGSPFDMMTTFGISYSTAGENIAMGYATPEAVINAWMNSEGHRANILNSAYTQIGVGYVADGNYWTQEFIG